MFILLFAKITAAPFMWLFFRYRIHGKKNLRRRAPFIIMTNHTSYADALIVNMLYPLRRIHYMATEEVFEHNRLMTFFLECFGAFPVRRGADNDDAVARAVGLLNSGKVFAITPEGRINREGGMLPFRRGVVRIAARTDAPILPVYILKRDNILKRQHIIAGEPIYFASLSEKRDLTPEEMKPAAEALREKMINLQRGITI